MSLKAAKASENGNIPCGETVKMAWSVRKSPMDVMGESCITSIARNRIQDFHKLHLCTLTHSPNFGWRWGPFAKMAVIDNKIAAYIKRLLLCSFGIFWKRFHAQAYSAGTQKTPPTKNRELEATTILSSKVTSFSPNRSKRVLSWGCNLGYVDDRSLGNFISQFFS